MNLVGSIAGATAPLSLEVQGSVDGLHTGSSFVDTVVGSVADLPGGLLYLASQLFHDLGSVLQVV